MTNGPNTETSPPSIKPGPSTEAGPSRSNKLAATPSNTTSMSAVSQALKTGETPKKASEPTKKPSEPAKQPPPPVLVGDKICVAEKHFSLETLATLKDLTKDLGATFSPHGECSILLVNPLSSGYKDEMAQMAAIKSKYPKLVQPTVLPYHWLLTCLARSARIEPTEDLAVPSPIIVSPNRSLDHGPLKVWVSVNVNRTELEGDAHVARSTVVNQLLERGALISDKRALADILVVDRSSSFFSNIILKEREKYGRKSQRIVERDWVDDCVKNGRMVWPPMEQEPEGEAEVDSMAEDEPLRAGKGPGRPTGRPRIDYTPADGDFLCRYLAAYHPGGSWMSRKTYATMCSMADQFPIITRHSDQSWHEHFKKNAATYEGRVKRYIVDGMDRALRTEKEREVDRAKKRAQHEREDARQEGMGGDDGGMEVEIPAEGPRPSRVAAEQEDVDMQGAGQAGPSARPMTVAEREGARLTRMAAEAIEASGATEPVLVTLDTPTEAVVPQAETQAGPSAKRKRLVEHDEAAAPIDNHPMVQKPHPVPPAPNAVPTPANRPTEPVAPPSTGIPAGTSIPPKLGRGSKPIASETARSEPPAGARPAEAQRAVAHSPFQPIQAGPPASTGPSEFKGGSQPGSRAPAAVEVSATSAVPHEPKRGPKPPPAQLMRAEGSASRSQEPETGPSTSTARPAPTTAVVTPSHGSGQPARATTTDRRRFSTPAQTPGGRRSLLQEHIRSSESKRRRMLERAASRGRKPGESSEPDTVAVPTHIMPAPQYIASRSTTPTTHSPAPPRSPSPPLSRREREAKVAQGHQLVLAMQLEYGERIKGFAKKYNTIPSRVVQMMDELKSASGTSGGEGQMYWEHVEEALRVKYGY